METPFSRRRLIGMAGAVIGGAAADTLSCTEPVTLRGAARAAGLTFSGAVRADSLDDARLRALLLAECAVLTPELELKWAAIAPVAERRDYNGADRIAAFARSGKMRLRGHTMLWHRSVPDWAAQRLARDPDWGIVEAHIVDVAGRYRDLVDDWDVVNEPIEIGPRPDGLRPNAFLAAFGSAYIARALHAAHRAAPDARLFINDYDLEYDRADQRARRAALLALARSLVGQRAPLHGIGIQGHLDIGKGSIATEEVRTFIAALGDLGLRVAITELDVKERDLILPAPERDRRVADHVATFLAAVLPQRAVRSIGCWGLSDQQSWLKVTADDRARYPGAWTDGSSPGLNRGLPYDADYAPKPMHDSLIAAMAARR